MVKKKLLIRNLNSVVKVCSNYEEVIYGKEQKVEILKDNGKIWNVVVDKCGNISEITSGLCCYDDSEFDQVVDGRGCCLIPGLVDSHTHPVWSGDRVGEFAMKLAGKTYMEIHEAGGGIHYTVEQTRKSSEDELYELLLKRLESMIKLGTTLVECKSGYGLNAECEMKMLKVIERARRDPNVNIDISTTFLAHAVPKGKTADEACYDVINKQLPEVMEHVKNGTLTVDNIDVFCEKGVFDVEQTRKILNEGKKFGLKINFHGDELNCTGSAELGADLNAHAISHLEEISDEGIKAMSKSKSAAVILPATAYILKLPHPPVRKMIKSEVPVALATDFNPNAYCLSMPTTMHMGCVLFGMSMDESLISATINSAYSLGMSRTHGSIEVGKRANFVLVDDERWEHLIYRFSSTDEVIKMVICGGVTSYKKDR